MKLKILLMSGCTALMFSALPMMASTAPDTRTTLQDIQTEAQDAYDHADQLQSFGRDQQVGWEAQGNQLTAIKEDVNQIETQISRLEAARSADAPQLHAALDRLAGTARLMVDNTQDAILFGNAHQEDLWLADFRKYVDNLDNEAHTLTDSVNQTLNSF